MGQLHVTPHMECPPAGRSKGVPVAACTRHGRHCSCLETPPPPRPADALVRLCLIPRRSCIFTTAGFWVQSQHVRDSTPTVAAPAHEMAACMQVCGRRHRDVPGRADDP